MRQGSHRENGSAVYGMARTFLSIATPSDYNTAVDLIERT
jgi:hypothetical protein